MHRRQVLHIAAIAPLLLLNGMPPSQVDITIQAARQAWLDGNGSAFAALFADDGVFILPGQRWQGQAAILAVFQEFASTHTVNTIDIRSVVHQGPTGAGGLSRAVVEWYWEDTETQTGTVSRAEDAIAIDMRGDRIQRWREYIDEVSVTQID